MAFSGRSQAGNTALELALAPSVAQRPRNRTFAAKKDHERSLLFQAYISQWMANVPGRLQFCGRAKRQEFISRAVYPNTWEMATLLPGTCQGAEDMHKAVGHSGFSNADKRKGAAVRSEACRAPSRPWCFRPSVQKNN